MTFDAVHDLQKAFRGLVEAFSFPGHRVDLVDLARRIAPRVGDPSVNPTLALGAAVLVDQDVGYAVVGNPALASFLVEWSSSAPKDLDTAPLVVMADFDDGELAKVLGRSSVGTLADPQGGATVLVGVEDLAAGSDWTWSGPGLEHPSVGPLPAGDAWVKARNAATSEFPLGVDLAFFDRKGRFMALPRTTRLAPATRREA